MKSATTTNTVPIAMLATTATATFEATILEADTDLMARAGWLLLGSSGAQLVSLLVDAIGDESRGQVLTKDGEVGGCVVRAEKMSSGG